jgi:metalloprotease
MIEDGHFISRRQILSMAAIAGGISVAGPASAGFNIGKMVKAGANMVKAETLSDADLKASFDMLAIDSDQRNPLASSSDSYGTRISSIAEGLQHYDGLNLDIQAYLVKDVNAFAMANGTVRIFAGLMDQFNDNEIRYVIGHEIGHIKSGHTKERMQTALRANALRQAAGSVGGTVGKIADGKIGEFFSKVITAQHSQANEKEADAYAVGFLKTNNYGTDSALSALDKLAAMTGDGKPVLPWLATHPSPEVRAKYVRSLL